MGPARARLLARLGAETIGNILLHLPRAYQRFVPCARLSDAYQLTDGEGVIVHGRVATSSVQPTRGRRHLAVEAATLQDETGTLPLRWFVPFRGPLPKPRLTRGSRVTVRGRLTSYGGIRFLRDAEVKADTDGVSNEEVVPVYPLTKGISQRFLRTLIQAALEMIGVGSLSVPQDRQLPAPHEVDGDWVKFALRLLHTPATLEHAEYGRRLLALREIYELSRKNRLLQRGPVLREKWKADDGELVRSFLARLPFTPTEAQRRAMEEIRHGMAGTVGMRRILSGDVGSGKSLVIAYTLLKGVEAKGQAVLIAPTRILANQHATTLSRLYSGLEVRLGLLTAETAPEERGRVLGGLRDGSVDVLVATHAALEPEVEYRKLLVGVIDEQHRFGVEQRMALERKGPLHTLWVSATPIPQSMAQIVYGAVPLSVLDERPPGRVPVETRWVSTKRRGDVYRFLSREIESGGRAFVVCPAIDEDEESGLPGAVELWRKLERLRPGGYPVALIHGRLTPLEQEQALSAFVSGAARTLVATSMVEVGVDVPEATVMVIEGADRFGLAQLHQLRGRVGRGTRKAYTFLVSDGPTQKARERLHALRTTDDGFALAEVDLKLRGPGEFAGLRQSGVPDLRFADLARDLDLFRMVVAETGAGGE